MTSVRGHNGSFPEFSEAHTPAASIFLLHFGYSFLSLALYHPQKIISQSFLNRFLKERSISQSEHDFKIKQQKKQFVPF